MKEGMEGQSTKGIFFSFLILWYYFSTKTLPCRRGSELLSAEEYIESANQVQTHGCLTHSVRPMNESRQLIGWRRGLCLLVFGIEVSGNKVQFGRKKTHVVELDRWVVLSRLQNCYLSLKPHIEGRVLPLNCLLYIMR